MADPTILERSRQDVGIALAENLRHRSERLAAPACAEIFGAAFDRFADARIVLLGEATHGSAEFYQARAAITRRLVERHGFTIVAVEADWPDAARIDAYVRHHAARPGAGEAFTRFPVWMWRNAEVLAFLDRLRAYNEPLPPDRRVSFHGLDIYSLGASIASVLDYLDRTDPAAARLARQRYGCLAPFQERPADYGLALLASGEESCEPQVVEQLTALLANRLAYMQKDSEGFFDAAQNARIVRAAEHYYRIMYRGSRESWNLRDRHMFDTLRALLAHRGPTAKAVVWAHNSHIGNAAATAMGWAGEFNIGELCRTAYGDAAVAIGFGTDRGTVAAASDWDGPMEIKALRPARPDSYEYAFRKTGLARSLTEWRGGGELAEILRQPLLERAVGVIYRPESELMSHYFEAILSEQFDAYVWFEETRAVTPLPAPPAQGVPDTYPFGL
jgi:erythromycin esterase-like protein